ncbi:MAG: aldo/keto reductase [Geminicoccaceae bacterium]|nr:aldo/keto reductase [Geminicoccaceae bacterium]MCS7266971.1 aldo/keto reductase [Geminicoccaceae bacterium]MDW8341662.1 aldo/keto reductase [Geminicoccaceae bacterium]
MEAMLPRRKIGRTGLEVTVLGLGGAPLGDLYERIPDERARATVEAAWRVGIRLFDTAPLYGCGLSEHRMGEVLRSKPRDAFVLSTKIGRILEPADPSAIDRHGWAGGLDFRWRFDYSAEGAKRSIEDSLQRLGLSRIDIVFVHDLDLWWCPTPEIFEQRFREIVNGAWPVLADLRDRGVVRAIGLGVNAVAPCVRLAREADPDVFLLAGRYTLLEQGGLEDLLPLAREKGFSLLLGGPFNSGILATGAVPGARYDYKPAPPEILARVRRIEAVCARHGVPLKAAAIQFPLGLDEVAAIVAGAVRPEEVEENRRLIAHPIPAAFWQELRGEGLIAPDCPVPGAAPGA